MSLWVNLLGLFLIGFIVWWFWLARPAQVRAVSDSVDVIVDNGVYTPATIEVNSGATVNLNFIRRDASPCAEQVIFPDLEISVELPLNQTKRVEITPPQAGEFAFTCQMGMYRGMLIVK
ncbi:plastocyanin [Candidatus Tenderia electrophaga]|jgi:plastocyanin domain-containing protein|uniref:Plastocyanin n=1 Tax=Candidatus Tenderia electrophaga TaxID=1748243 RepID=A0A0S2TAY5_9GAMM|nr:plastocyanin [Candidatus Tenderia electrophaga]